MDIFTAIKERHCFRGQFTDQIPDKDKVRAIVQAGLEAPSGCNAQTTSFVIVDDPEKVSALHQIQGGNLAYQTAKTYIAIVIDKEPKPVYMGMSFQVEDASTAVQNILLAATAYGYVSVWLDGWLRRNGVAEQISEILAIPADKQLRVLLPLGVPAEAVSAPTKMTFSERVFYNSYSK